MYRPAVQAGPKLVTKCLEPSHPPPKCQSRPNPHPRTTQAPPQPAPLVLVVGVVIIVAALMIARAGILPLLHQRLLTSSLTPSCSLPPVLASLLSLQPLLPPLLLDIGRWRRLRCCGWRRQQHSAARSTQHQQQQQQQHSSCSSTHEGSGHPPSRIWNSGCAQGGCDAGNCDNYISKHRRAKHRAASCPSKQDPKAPAEQCGQWGSW
jgi:hypothetical protein